MFKNNCEYIDSGLTSATLKFTQPAAPTAAIAGKKRNCVRIAKYQFCHLVLRNGWLKINDNIMFVSNTIVTYRNHSIQRKSNPHFESRPILNQKYCIILVHIAVGTSIARCPLHRSRRADFPHRALQQHSLPHKGSCKLLLRLLRYSLQ